MILLDTVVLSELRKRQRSPEVVLSVVLADITPENLHTEVDFGTPVGKELL